MIPQAAGTREKRGNKHAEPWAALAPHGCPSDVVVGFRGEDGTPESCRCGRTAPSCAGFTLSEQHARMLQGEPERQLIPAGAPSSSLKVNGVAPDQHGIHRQAPSAVTTVAFLPLDTEGRTREGGVQAVLRIWVSGREGRASSWHRPQTTDHPLNWTPSNPKQHSKPINVSPEHWKTFQTCLPVQIRWWKAPCNEQFDVKETSIRGE